MSSFSGQGRDVTWSVGSDIMACRAFRSEIKESRSGYFERLAKRSKIGTNYIDEWLYLS